MENQYMLVIPKDSILQDTFVADLLTQKGYVLEERKFLEDRQIEEDCYYTGKQEIEIVGSEIILSRKYHPPAIAVPYTDLEFFTILGHLKAKYNIKIEKTFWTLVLSSEIAIKFLIDFQYKAKKTSILKPMFDLEPKTILVEVTHG